MLRLLSILPQPEVSAAMSTDRRVTIDSCGGAPFQAICNMLTCIYMHPVGQREDGDLLVARVLCATVQSLLNMRSYVIHIISAFNATHEGF